MENEDYEQDMRLLEAIFGADHRDERNETEECLHEDELLRTFVSICGCVQLDCICCGLVVAVSAATHQSYVEIEQKIQHPN